MSQMTQIIVNPSSEAQEEPRREDFYWGGDDPRSTESAKAFRSLNDLSEDSMGRLSSEIFQRPNVFSILARAFSNGLTRDIFWNLDGIAEDDLDSYIKAARIYKRGVAVSRGGVIEHHGRSRATSYAIDFPVSIKDCFKTLSENDLLVVDQNVADQIPYDLLSKVVTLKFSESSKNIQTLAHVTAKLREHCAAKKTNGFVVFIVGGGIAGDVVGMAAGLLGLKTHYVPTTLLSMVDSSVGGKVGINFEPYGKNQIGLFHNPIGVSVCSDWLKTLPAEEFRAGISEGLKHALLAGDLQLWQELLDCAKSDVQSLSAQVLAKVIHVKVDVVSRDPWELGERAILNFGHTWGHVIESMALKKGVSVLHGECVAFGMLHALRLSHKYFSMQADSFIEGILRSGILPSKEKLSAILGPTPELENNRQDILNLLLADKKSKADNLVRFVLLKAPGVVARGTDGSWTVPFNPNDVWRDIKSFWGTFLGDTRLSED
jgi:3-dehydroquinate synthase